MSYQNLNMQNHDVSVDQLAMLLNSYAAAYRQQHPPAKRRRRVALIEKAMWWNNYRKGHDLEATDEPFRFLDLPGELREGVYHHIADGLAWIRDQKNKRLANAAPLDNADKYPLVAPPIIHTSRQIRKEFKAYVKRLFDRRAVFGDQRIPVCVCDFNFDPLIQRLERFTSVFAPYELVVHLDFTEPGNENWGGMLQWMCALDNMAKGKARSPRIVYKHGPRSQEFDAESKMFRPDFIHTMLKKNLARHATRALFRTLRPHMLMLIRSFHGWLFNVQHTEQLDDGILTIYANSRMPKRRRLEHLEKQAKRRRIGEEDRWAVEAGFGKHGVKDEDYCEILDGIAKVELE